jgi:hypothetical protein
MSADRVRDTAATLERCSTDAALDQAATSLASLADEVRQCLEFVPRAVEQVRQKSGDKTA